MTWLLSLLGIGGIGAALFFIPSALPAAINALSAVLGVLRRWPWQIACIGLLCLALWFLHGRTEARSELAAIHTAQKANTTAQVAANHVPAAKSQAIAEKSDAEAPAYYEEGRVARVAYADTHRVSAACAPRLASVPRADNAPAEYDSASYAPGMVAVSQGDFDTLTSNSTRLAKVQQDAESLIVAGVAVATAP